MFILLCSPFVFVFYFFFFLMIRRPPRSTQGVSSAASDVYKRQLLIKDFNSQVDLAITSKTNNSQFTYRFWCYCKISNIFRSFITSKQNNSTYQQEQNNQSLFHNSSTKLPMYSALIPVSYTHLTLPTILLVQISVVAVSLKKKKNKKQIQMVNKAR
eukprot:TRINITY_DN10688_c0_g1_i15.p2 TRINITY_DN10688_c0_g1~~TRINITY_DN10688_c0_g1_i15.p2  ORF type:complete len:157 (-),score=28.08 TRINITY_DN10688_c0_g1_i15:83-553(-)